METADDTLQFAEEDAPTGSDARPWKLLICDDDQEIHTVTELALRGFRLEDRPLQFVHAYTGAEGVEAARSHPDLALILMDVVMESDDAGLRAVQAIREELGNRRARVVLRTGQPGQAPEHDVVTRFDINDYKEKTELTAKKLFTLVYTSLGQYAELVNRDVRQMCLESVIESANTVFRRRSPDRLASGVLRSLLGLLGLPIVDDPTVPQGGLAVALDEPLRVLHAVGCHAELEGRPYEELPRELDEAIRGGPPQGCLWSRSSDRLIAWLQADAGTSVALVATAPSIQVIDTHMLNLFLEGSTIALKNAQLNCQMEESQRELVLMLGEAIERRSRETGNHVRRVGEYCRRLGELAGLPPAEAELLGVAAPLHDAGKIAIPDAILNKPGRHTDDESEIMRTHAALGAEIFQTNDLPVLQAAAIVARRHHERWDGKGYPDRLAGEDIHIYGRIVALADVFDALCSSRCYKPAWKMDEVLEVIRTESGKHFDPELTRLFLDHIDEFIAIRERLPD